MYAEILSPRLLVPGEELGFAAHTVFLTEVLEGFWRAKFQGLILLLIQAISLRVWMTSLCSLIKWIEEDFWNLISSGQNASASFGQSSPEVEHVKCLLIFMHDSSFEGLSLLSYLWWFMPLPHLQFGNHKYVLQCCSDLWNKYGIISTY